MRDPIARVILSGLIFACATGLARARETAPPSVEPSASPGPAIVVSPAPASPTPAATSGAPIVLDRTRVQIVPGGSVVVNVAGGTGALVASPPGPNVDVRYDAAAHRLTLVGRAPGTSTVTLSDAAGGSADVAVLVAPPAGIVPTDVTLELGGNVSPDFATAKIQAAIVASAQLRPGTRVDVRGVTPGSALAPGGTLEATARVHVDGAGAYVDVDGTTSVHLKVDSLGELDPQILFYSDDPEKLIAGSDGVVYRGTLDAAKPARTYFYHVAAASTHALYLVLRATGADARVQILGDAAGPTDAFGYAGHLSTVRYMSARRAQASVVAGVSADAPYVQQLGARELRPGELVAGAFDLRVLSGAAVEVDVISAVPGTDPTALLGGPESPSDGHGRRGEFDLTAVPPLALAYAVGAPDPAPFSIGVPTIPNLRPGGRALGGDYGVVRSVSLAVSNPGATPASVYFYELPAGGSATTTIWFAGAAQPTEIPCVIRQNRYTVAQFDLAPGEARTVTGEYMTDGASSFPLLFGLTAAPPSPPPGPYSPDACNPRTPPPTTPVPSASAAPASETPAVETTPAATAPVPPPPPIPATASPAPAPTETP